MNIRDYRKSVETEARQGPEVKTEPKQWQDKWWGMVGGERPQWLLFNLTLGLEWVPLELRCTILRHQCKLLDINVLCCSYFISEGTRAMCVLKQSDLEKELHLQESKRDKKQNCNRYILITEQEETMETWD